MALAPLSDNIQINAPKAADNRYGKTQDGRTVPFSSIAEAKTSIPEDSRFLGMTFYAIDKGDIKEFWWLDSIINDPVEKTGDKQSLSQKNQPNGYMGANELGLLSPSDIDGIDSLSFNINSSNNINSGQK